MRILNLKFCVYAFISAVFLALSLSPAYSQTKEKVTLKFATFAPAKGFTISKIIIPFLDRVVADSQGTLAYKIYGGGTLGRNPAEQLKLVQSGVADLAFVIPSYTPGAFELYNVPQLPTLARTSEQAATGLWRLHSKGLLTNPDSVKLIGLFTTGANALHLKETAKSINDIKARKLRVAGAVQNNMAKVLNAIPVGNIRAPGTAEAVSRGVVGGTFMDWIASSSFKVNQVATHHIDYEFGFVSIMIPINANTWSKLSDAARKAFEKHGGVALAKAAGTTIDNAVAKTKEKTDADNKQNVIKLSESERKTLTTTLKTVVNDWAKKSADHKRAIEIFSQPASN